MNNITLETRSESFYAKNTKATKYAVLQALKDGPKTAREIAGYTNVSLNDVRSRLTELKQLGKVEAVEKKKDVTGVNVAIFRLKAVE